MNLVPIKVKIGLKENGNAKYPNFNLMNEVKNKNTDWSTYIDMYGSGWLYDYIGHKEDELDSPFGMQWGMILVPKEFADEAISLFPDEVTKLNDIDAQSFFETRVKKKEPDFLVNEEALKIYDIKDKYKIPLSTEEETKKAKALDPEDEEEGIKRNKDKVWSEYKAKRGITIVQ